MTVPQMLHQYKILYLGIGALTLLAVELALLLARECWRELTRKPRFRVWINGTLRDRLARAETALDEITRYAYESDRTQSFAYHARGLAHDPRVVAADDARYRVYHARVRRSFLRIRILALLVRLTIKP